MQSFIVVSGVPASGKTTVGRALAEALGWPFLDKDDLLEALFEKEGCLSREQRSRLSRQADARFEIAARALDRAVLCSFWRHPEIESDSGTPSAWLLGEDIRVLEVVCWCSPRIAARRFLERSRHVGHQDAVWDEDGLVEQAERVEGLLPLGLGRYLGLRMDGPLEMDALLEAVRRWGTAAPS